MFILDTEKLIQKLKEEGDQPLWEYALNQEMERSGRSLYGEKRAGTIRQRPHRRKCLQI